MCSGESAKIDGLQSQELIGREIEYSGYNEEGGTIWLWPKGGIDE